MPIKDRSKYPKDWKKISARVRERDGGRCRFCGIEDGAVGHRRPDGTFEREYGLDAQLMAGLGLLQRIVISAIHLDHSPENCADENLVSACQACHLEHDQGEHKENAAETRKDRKDRGRPLLC